MAFDVSGSMYVALADAQQAAREFLNNCDLTTTSIGIISVSDRAEVNLRASQNSKDILRAIDGLYVGSTGGGNAAHPFDLFHDLYKKVSGLRYAIVLADGVWSNQSGAVRQAKRCHTAEIQIISIGFGGADKKFLADIASTSDMSIFTTQRGLGEAFSTIAREITQSGSTGVKGMRLQGR
jgi:molecular chaperone DnaK